MGRVIQRVALGLLALAAAILVLAFGYRAWRQNENARALAITSPNGIDEAAFVKIGGIDQWLTIRGENRANPVVLILHGGPGGAMSMMSILFRSWERDFTVVQWDQRGAGRTYGRNGTDEKPMTAERMTRDGIEVAEYLVERLRKKKIVLLGHSWGSELGVLMAKRRPDLFHAYVGTGQVVAKEEKEEILYARLMKRLEAAHDRDGIVRLQAIGPPPYKSEDDLEAERAIQGRFDVPSEKGFFSMIIRVLLFSPDTSLGDLYEYNQGRHFAGDSLYKELLGYDARKLGSRFDLPVFIFNGDHDLTTPADLAKAWFDTLEAPKKEFVILRGGGHSALMTMPDIFLAELKARVRPIAMRN